MTAPAAPLHASPAVRPSSERLARFAPLRRRRRRASRLYTAWVWVLRWMVPLAVIGLVVVVFGWAEIQERFNPLPERPPIAITTEPDTTVRAPRYIGTDAADRPFSLFGAAARGDGALDTSDTVEMDDPDGEITLEDGTWLAVRAGHGRLEQAAQMLTLSDNVEIFRDDGTLVETDEVVVDLEAEEAWGDQPIRVLAPGLEVVAQGFRVDNAGETIVFVGRTSLVLRPDSAPIAVDRPR